MKNLLTTALLSTLLVLSAQVEARTLVSAGTRCFQIGDVIPGGWDKTLKIKMQQALSDKTGQIVHVDALEHGFKATNPPAQYVNELTGSATIAPPNDLLPGGSQLQISLVGTSYGNNLEDITKNGVFSFVYALRLDPKTLAGPITGYQIFTPISNGQIGEIIQIPTDTQLQPISCQGL